MDSLVNRPNNIISRQKAMQADPRPVYLKTPRAKLYMGLFMTIFTIGGLGVTQGLYKMATGNKK